MGLTIINCNLAVYCPPQKNANQIKISKNCPAVVVIQLSIGCRSVVQLNPPRLCGRPPDPASREAQPFRAFGSSPTSDARSWMDTVPVHADTTDLGTGPLAAVVGVDKGCYVEVS